MASTPSCEKQKQKILGRSEFIRHKIQHSDAYIPKARVPNRCLFNSQFKTRKNRFKTEVTDQQKQKVIQNAVAQLRLGKSIALDWGTKANFRSTYTKSYVLSTNSNSIRTAVKKQDKDLLQRRKKFEIIVRNKKQQHQKLLDQIKFKKANELRKKIEIDCRVKQIVTLKPNIQLQQFVTKMQKVCLSPNNSIRNSRMSRKSIDNMLNSLEGDSRTKIFKIQQQILKRSKLSILKRQLQQKFFEIRQAYKLQDQKFQ